MHRMLKTAVQQGHSERRGEKRMLRYVELLSEARTPLEDIFSILLVGGPHPGAEPSRLAGCRKTILVCFVYLVDLIHLVQPKTRQTK